MCFSTEASFVAAGMLTLISVATFFNVHSRKIIPFASIPLLFAIQQAIEGITWVSLNAGDNSSFLYQFSVFSYLFIACILWPVWMPASLYMLERKPYRK